MSTAEWKVRNADKMRAYRRKHYHNNKLRYIEAFVARKQRIKKWIDDYKKGCICGRCGEDFYACLQFHHRDPSIKDFNLSEAVLRGYSLKRVKDEIEKCDVLCASCHIKVHWEQKHAPVGQW